MNNGCNLGLRDRYLQASEPKSVNPDDILYRVNSLRLVDLHITLPDSKMD